MTTVESAAAPTAAVDNGGASMGWCLTRLLSVMGSAMGIDGFVDWLEQLAHVDGLGRDERRCAGTRG